MLRRSRESAIRAAATDVTESFAARHTSFPRSLHWCKLTSLARNEATVRAAVTPGLHCNRLVIAS